MKIRVYAVNQDGDEREIGTCVTDSPTRAIQMYEGDDQEDETLTYDILD